MCFHAFGSKCFRVILNTTPQKRAVSGKLLITENRIEKLLLVPLLLLLLFGQIVIELLVLSGPRCNISTYTQDYEFKFSIQTKFDTLISNLSSYVQYKINMMSL